MVVYDPSWVDIGMSIHGSNNVLLMTKETLPYTLAALPSPVLSECPSSVGGIVEGCEPRTFSGIHQLKHGHWMSMT